MPDNNIPKEIIDGLYVPEFNPQDLKLNEFFENSEEKTKESVKKINKKIKETILPSGNNIDGPQKPHYRYQG